MRPFRRIAAYAHDGTGALGLGVVAEVFSDRTARGLPGFDFALCGDQVGSITTDVGLAVRVEHDLSHLVEADLVFLLPTHRFDHTPTAGLIEAVRRAHERGAIIAASCCGSVMLASTGLLDGKRATTHWRFAGDFARAYPDVTVDPDALYVDEGQIVTGAGAAAALDLCLYLLRREHGAAIANAIARELVVPPHREGGQAQFIATPVPDALDDDRLVAVIGWARENLQLPLSVPALAARALMSPRSFARHFKATVGASPHAWVLAQRLQLAEELLETTELSIDEIARTVGFQTTAALRAQFLRKRGVAPQKYRRAFGRRLAEAS